MRNFVMQSATAALFVVAALVACHGAGTAYNPALNEGISAESSASLPDLTTGPEAKITCKAPMKDPGSYLAYFAHGNVKRGTFRAQTGTSSGAIWYVYKYVKVKPTPTPSPSPTASPTSTPKTMSYYFYYGQFVMKNKQTGCAFLTGTKSGKPFKGTHYNSLTNGFPRLKPGHYKASIAEQGAVKSITISHLSSKGGSGSVTLVTSAGKPYTSGTVKFNGRIVIKFSDGMPEWDEGAEPRKR